MKPASRLSKNNPEAASIAAASLVVAAARFPHFGSPRARVQPAIYGERPTERVFGEGASKAVIMMVKE